MDKMVKVEPDLRCVIPAEALRKLHVRPGQELLMDVGQDRIVLIPEPEDYVARMKGLHKDIWSEKSGTRFLEEERAGWE